MTDQPGPVTTAQAATAATNVRIRAGILREHLRAGDLPEAYRWYELLNRDVDELRKLLAALVRRGDRTALSDAAKEAEPEMRG